MSVIPQSVLLWKTVTVAAVVFTVFWVGRGHGIQIQTERSAQLIERKNAALRDAGDALSAAAKSFRQIDNETRLAEVRAEEWERAARAADKSGAEGLKMLEQRIKELASDSERERFTCTEAEMRICGTPLR